MKLLESYIRSVLLEKGRFRRGDELAGWLIGVNCSRGEFNDVFRELEGNQVTDRSSPHAYIFNKNEEIINHIESSLGTGRVDRAGDEFSDNLPIFVLRIVGDLNSDASISAGKIKIIDCFDWIVHDMWHELVDDIDWYRHIVNISDGYSMDMEDDLEKAFYKKSEIEEDCFVFLDHYGFTVGVGEEDAFASMSAFSVMRRDIHDVNSNVFRNKMKDYRAFRTFYKKLYKNGPLIWNKIFKLFEEKIVCLCQ